MRKSLTAASAALPALLLLAACSTGSSHTDGTPSASPTTLSTLAGHAPLTVQQLSRALVTDTDLPGWVIEQSSSSDGVQTTAPEEFNPDDLSAQGDSGGQAVLHADIPGCQPLADTASTQPRIHRMASVGAEFAPAPQAASSGSAGSAGSAGSSGSFGPGAAKVVPTTVNQMLVASHAPGDAQKVMASLRTALTTCTRFTATGGDGTRTPFSIAGGPKVTVGDEAVAYLMTDVSDKKTGAALVTVVRTGDTITSYLSTRSAGGAGPVPLAVARKQDAKLRAVLARQR
ncbi:hypothetical protein [Actinacidiphila acidipaludis]|uniref:PknH-like extracellular domain-containing protein n=1 Tax=Actinacidiphila acidipaludis TaxID=2873382 RepID=A0ABS7Q318_9ACTN|nr:hypothetical protein [Streptomyces acidipaludis]MBY8876840.1 hypothetical protein [Streptomyces acidipaludis]